MDIFYEKLSKKLSYILRHHPEEFNLELDEHGWVGLSKLLTVIKTESRWQDVDEQTLAALIAQSAKKRFEMTNGKIRALYGHSTPVKIHLEKTEPPAILYHGTARRFIAAIKVKGLLSQKRQYVHLSTDVETAREVGRRRDPQSVILQVKAFEAWKDGISFYKRGENIWLADNIPPKYLDFGKD